MVSSDQLEYAIANSEIIKNIQSRLIDMDQLLRLQQSASIATSPLPPSPPVTEAIEPAIEDEDKPWLTLEELLSCDYQDWPTSIEGLRVKAKREAWTKRKRGKAYEYQAKLPHHE
jgi:hypothetical protein